MTITLHVPYIVTTEELQHHIPQKHANTLQKGDNKYNNNNNNNNNLLKKLTEQ